LTTPLQHLQHPPYLNGQKLAQHSSHNLTSVLYCDLLAPVSQTAGCSALGVVISCRNCYDCILRVSQSQSHICFLHRTPPIPSRLSTPTSCRSLLLHASLHPSRSLVFGCFDESFFLDEVTNVDIPIRQLAGRNFTI